MSKEVFNNYTKSDYYNGGAVEGYLADPRYFTLDTEEYKKLLDNASITYSTSNGKEYSDEFWKQDGSYYAGVVDDYLANQRYFVLDTEEYQAIVKGGNEPEPIGPKSNEIWYTSVDKQIIEPYSGSSLPSIVSNTYKGEKGVIVFEVDLTTIGNSAFRSRDLISVTIPNCVTSIGDYAFQNCSNLILINIPDSVTSIGNNVFGGCVNLPIIDNLRYADTYLVETVDKYYSSYTIKDGTKWINQYAFQNCSYLSRINIPSSVTYIGQNAFYRCNSLTSVTLDSDTIVSKTYNSSSNIGKLFGGQVKKYTIGDGVTSIGGYVFYTCTGLTSVTIPNSVTSIGEFSFSKCSGLASVIIPNSVTSIGERSFWGCSSLTSVTIPNSVTSIGESSFLGCSSLTSVTIGNGLTKISKNAFYSCSKLGSIVIPNNIISIESDAFSYCDKLTSVTLDSDTIVSKTYNSSSNIGKLFGGQVKKYTIGDSVTSIGERAFSSCNSLTSVTIGNSVTSIGKQAFSICSNLTSVIIPNSVTSIGEWAFSSCSSLTSMIIPNGVTSIGDGTFFECYNLASVNIPDNVTSIGEYAFSSCSSLTSMIIPNGVTSIGNQAFQNCRSLASVTIPNSVTSIGDGAFGGCTGLASVTVEAVEPPTSGSNVFQYASDCPIYVPVGSVNAYKSAANWSTYASRIQAIP